VAGWHITSVRKFDVCVLLHPKTVTNAPDHVNKLCGSRMSSVLGGNSPVLRIEVGNPLQRIDPWTTKLLLAVRGFLRGKVLSRTRVCRLTVVDSH